MLSDFGAFEAVGLPRSVFSLGRVFGSGWIGFHLMQGRAIAGFVRIDHSKRGCIAVG